MATSHVVGGGAAAFVGAVVVSLINHFFHSHVSDADALIIGGAAVAAGAGVGRVVETVGLLGAFKVLLRGAAKPSVGAPPSA